MKGIYSPLEEAKYNVVHDYPLDNLKARPRGAVALAPLVGRSAAVLANKVNPTLDTHHLTVDEAVLIQHAAKDYRILYAEASALGHVCIKLVDYSGIPDIELLKAYTHFNKEVGDTADAINSALADGDITKQEFNRISKEMDEDVRAIFGLRARLEALVND